MRSLNFSTAWPNSFKEYFYDSRRIYRLLASFAKYFRKSVFCNVIVPLPKSQTRHPARAQAPLNLPYVVIRGQKLH